MKKGRVIDRDKGYSKFAKQMKELSGGRYIAIGVLGDEAEKQYEAGDSIVSIAAIHEYGNEEDRPPQRSFLRGWTDHNKRNIDRVFEQYCKDVTAGKDIDLSFKEIAMWAVAGVKTFIRNGIKPDLADSTKEAKARNSIGPKDTPLIDTGQLLNSINFDIRRDKPKK